LVLDVVAFVLKSAAYANRAPEVSRLLDRGTAARSLEVHAELFANDHDGVCNLVAVPRAVMCCDMERAGEAQEHNSNENAREGNHPSHSVLLKPRSALG
jgi:hypothetical protein